jgi:Phage tail protein
MGFPITAPPVPLYISYIDPDGNTWDLSDKTFANGYVCSAIAGIEGIPVSAQLIPFLDGTAVPNLYIPQPGSIAIAILVGRPDASNNPADYYNLCDAIVRAFYTRRNELPAPGYLQVQRPDGSIRQVATYTTAGFDTPDVGLNDMAVYSLTLQTPDPYWEDIPEQTLIYQQGTAQGILPLLPISLSAGTVFGSSTITNEGNSITFPTWTITGPGTPTMINNTTGLSWSLNSPVPGGEVVQVVTKTGQQMATNITTGTSIWDQLTLTSLRQLWGLIPGPNQVSIEMAGASAVTSVQLTWTNRWNRA